MSFLNKEEFESMVEEITKMENVREEVILQSRSILRLSKQCIFALHRGDIDKATKLWEEMKKEVDRIKAFVEDNPNYTPPDSFNIALQEYVEATSYLHFLNEDKIPSKETLNVSTEAYLLGLMDLTGELVRKAVADSINHRKETVLKVRAFIEELYEWLLKFDWTHGQYRKKADMVRWNLNKIEDLLAGIETHHTQQHSERV